MIPNNKITNCQTCGKKLSKRERRRNLTTCVNCECIRLAALASGPDMARARFIGGRLDGQSLYLPREAVASDTVRMASVSGKICVREDYEKPVEKEKNRVETYEVRKREEVEGIMYVTLYYVPSS